MPRHPSGLLIRPTFFLRPVEAVAKDLLGRHLVAEAVALRITEVEAYGGPEDSASHCRHGRTDRNAPMWGPGGHAYIYLCYGRHWMLNLVTGPAGEGGAILIRGCDVVDGLATVQARRGGRKGNDLLAGPGKVGQALAVSAALNGHPVCAAGELEVRLGGPCTDVLATPRIGIGFALPADQAALRRFVAADSPRATFPGASPDPRDPARCRRPSHRFRPLD